MDDSGHFGGGRWKWAQRGSGHRGEMVKMVMGEIYADLTL